jgi:hypothetical protein
VVNVGLPAIGRSLLADAAALQWVINAYLLPLSALLLLGGALGDGFGRRRMLIAGILLFALGSLACAERRLRRAHNEARDTRRTPQFRVGNHDPGLKPRLARQELVDEPKLLAFNLPAQVGQQRCSTLPPPQHCGKTVLPFEGHQLGEWGIWTAPPARKRRDQARDRHHRMPIQRAQIDLTYGLATWTHEGQPRRTGDDRSLNSRIERRAGLAHHSAIPGMIETVSRRN